MRPVRPVTNVKQRFFYTNLNDMYNYYGIKYNNIGINRKAVDVMMVSSQKMLEGNKK